FLPMVMLRTGTGDFVRSMPVTVIFTLIASLVVSLTLTPFMASRLLRRRDPSRRSRRMRPLHTFLRHQVNGPYRKTLGYALTHPGRVLVIAVIVFAGSLALFPLVGVSLFPKAEKTQFLINVDTPEGTSLNRTDEVAEMVEFALAEYDEITSIATNVGHGNPRIYYNTFPKNETSTHAQLVVEASGGPDDVARLVRELRGRFSRVAGAEIEVKEFLQGPPIGAPIEISVAGDDLAVLRQLAAEIEEIVAGTPGTIDVDNPSSRRRTDLKVAINRDKAGLLGIPLVEIDQTVRASMAGLSVGNFRDREGEDYDIVLRLPVEGRPSVRDFDRISVPSVSGGRIPLRQAATLGFESSQTQIEHRDLERAATVTADVADGFNVAAVTEQIIDQLDELSFPVGYRYILGGEYESREESFGGMGQALVIALLGIFGILVLQFRSFSQPLIVFAAIPFAITGAVLALLLTGYTFSFMAFIGLTSLVGIVVNNSIILVDYANMLRREGRSVVDAVREAGESRFIPIVLTTLTTIGGLLPLTLQGSTLWSPMGWAIIGGLAMSTVLTLVVVPVLYRTMTPDTVEVPTA
ncbi:MAG: efflux RND transporter permease subunit, partial [Rhodothermales bacterium]|nr:efflux RND transporter permease subunit [Rhodothermales bacterium]